MDATQRQSLRVLAQQAADENVPMTLAPERVLELLDLVRRLENYIAVLRKVSERISRLTK